jgi:hypothetical protein
LDPGSLATFDEGKQSFAAPDRNDAVAPFASHYQLASKRRRGCRCATGGGVRAPRSVVCISHDGDQGVLDGLGIGVVIVVNPAGGESADGPASIVITRVRMSKKYKEYANSCKGYPFGDDRRIAYDKNCQPMLTQCMTAAQNRCGFCVRPSLFPGPNASA